MVKSTTTIQLHNNLHLVSQVNIVSQDTKSGCKRFWCGIYEAGLVGLILPLSLIAIAIAIAGVILIDLLRTALVKQGENTSVVCREEPDVL